MIKKIKMLFTVFIFLNFSNSLFADENFFKNGLQKYNEKKYEDSKFLFHRSIVFNPKNVESYLYLAKTYNFEKNEKEEIKNLNTVILLDPKNEEAVYMLIQIELKKTNYSKVKKLSENFLKICIKLCNKNKSILESLKNLEPKNES
jgi:tetratricopeptide (TPR) repeat protein